MKTKHFLFENVNNYSIITEFHGNFKHVVFKNRKLLQM